MTTFTVIYYPGYYGVSETSKHTFGNLVTDVDIWKQYDGWEKK